MSSGSRLFRKMADYAFLEPSSSSSGASSSLHAPVTRHRSLSPARPRMTRVTRSMSPVTLRSPMMMSRAPSVVRTRVVRASSPVVTRRRYSVPSVSYVTSVPMTSSATEYDVSSVPCYLPRVFAGVPRVHDDFVTMQRELPGYEHEQTVPVRVVRSASVPRSLGAPLYRSPTVVTRRIVYDDDDDELEEPIRAAHSFSSLRSRAQTARDRLTGPHASAYARDPSYLHSGYYPTGHYYPASHYYPRSLYYPRSHYYPATSLGSSGALGGLGASSLSGAYGGGITADVNPSVSSRPPPAPYSPLPAKSSSAALANVNFNNIKVPTLPLSAARKLAREVLCKTKGDPNYFD